MTWHPHRHDPVPRGVFAVGPGLRCSRPGSHEMPPGSGPSARKPATPRHPHPARTPHHLARARVHVRCRDVFIRAQDGAQGLAGRARRGQQPCERSAGRGLAPHASWQQRCACLLSPFALPLHTHTPHLHQLARQDLELALTEVFWVHRHAALGAAKRNVCAARHEGGAGGRWSTGAGVGRRPGLRSAQPGGRSTSDIRRQARVQQAGDPIYSLLSMQPINLTHP